MILQAISLRISFGGSMEKNRILIVGATSTVAREVAAQFAYHGKDLFLVGRNLKELERMRQDLAIRYSVVVDVGFWDANQYHGSELLIQQLEKKSIPLEGIFIASGYLGNHTKENWAEALQVLSTNFVGVCSLLHRVLNSSYRKGLQWISVITSVAGDRGRKSNYIYGAAKGGLSIYLQGLDHDLAKEKIKVIDIKLGLVDSPMTFGSKKSFLCASPHSVAKKIYATVYKQLSVAYIPGYWKYLMKIIRRIPRNLFVKSEL